MYIIYIYIYVYTYAYTFMYVLYKKLLMHISCVKAMHTHVYTHSYTHMCTYIYMYFNIYMQVYTCMSTTSSARKTRSGQSTKFCIASKTQRIFSIMIQGIVALSSWYFKKKMFKYHVISSIVWKGFICVGLYIFPNFLWVVSTPHKRFFEDYTNVLKVLKILMSKDGNTERSYWGTVQNSAMNWLHSRIIKSYCNSGLQNWAWFQRCVTINWVCKWCAHDSCSKEGGDGRWIQQNTRTADRRIRNNLFTTHTRHPVKPIEIGGQLQHLIARLTREHVSGKHGKLNLGGNCEGLGACPLRGLPSVEPRARLLRLLALQRA